MMLPVWCDGQVARATVSGSDQSGSVSTTNWCEQFGARESLLGAIQRPGSPRTIMGHESQCWRGQIAVADDGPSTSILPYPFGTRARGRATLDARHRDRTPRLPRGAANQLWSTPPAGCPRRARGGRASASCIWAIAIARRGSCATRALHGSRQRIGDSRAVAEGGQRRAKFFPGSGAACAPRPMARSVLAFEGEGVGADEVGFGVRPAGRCRGSRLR
jgi:hypothetical protein